MDLSFKYIALEENPWILLVPAADRPGLLQFRKFAYLIPWNEDSFAAGYLSLNIYA